MKRIGVFGSTGSVGENTLKIIAGHPEAFSATILAGGRNVVRLAEQALEYRPKIIVVGRHEERAGLVQALGVRAPDFRILSGPEGLQEAAGSSEVDIVVAAVSGAQGLPVSLGALEAGKRLGLANKESMVMAGPLLNELSHRCQASIIPIDSEHSALFQCLLTGRVEDVDKLILTASGGPFRTLPQEEFRRVTIEQALKHPTWTMGRKITIDSATMMNKALEIIEARWLFDVPRSRIDVVVHPQSIVHSMVLWTDGSVIAQMGAPDMRIPIQYAMTYPERIPGTVPTYSPEIFNGLNFYPPDTDKFSSLRLGFFAADQGGTYGAVLNAANEEAVARFLDGRLGFDGIFERVAAVVERHQPKLEPNLGDILAADAWAREEFLR